MAQNVIDFGDLTEHEGGKPVDFGDVEKASKQQGEIRQGPPKWKYTVSDISRPILEGVGLVGGGILGTAAAPVAGTVAGAGLGYGIGRSAANILDEQLGISKPPTLKQAATRSLKDVGQGMTLEMLGQAGGKVAEAGLKKLGNVAFNIAEKSLKVPPSVPAATRTRAIDTMLDEGIPISKRGLSKTKNILSDLEDQMDVAVASSPQKNNMIDTQSVLGPVKDLRDKMLNTVNGKELAAKLDGVVKNFMSQYGPQMTVEQAQAVKQNTNMVLRKAYGQLQDVTTESIKQITRGLKDRIAEEIPAITGINAKYGRMKDLEKVLERAVNRSGNWDFLSLSSAVAGSMVGGATGNVIKGAEAAGVWRILKSPPVQSRLAIAIKKTGAKGNPKVLARAITSAVYAKLSGNYQTPIEQSVLGTPDVNTPQYRTFGAEE